MNDPTRNPPASAMTEPAPKTERAIRTRLDEAVDATFPASDPVAIADPSRRTEEPRLPADARPGDVLTPRGEVRHERHHRHPGPLARAHGPQDIRDALRGALPWMLAGFVLQRLWMHRRR